MSFSFGMNDMAQAMFGVKGSTVKMWLREGYQNHDVLRLLNV